MQRSVAAFDVGIIRPHHDAGPLHALDLGLNALGVSFSRSPYKASGCRQDPGQATAAGNLAAALAGITVLAQPQ